MKRYCPPDAVYKLIVLELTPFKEEGPQRQKNCQKHSHEWRSSLLPMGEGSLPSLHRKPAVVGYSAVGHVGTVGSKRCVFSNAFGERSCCCAGVLIDPLT